MRTYDVTVKAQPVYGREGSGIFRAYKTDAGSRAVAAMRGVKRFTTEEKIKDEVSRTLTLTVTRVL